MELDLYQIDLEHNIISVLKKIIKNSYLDIVEDFDITDAKICNYAERYKCLLDESILFNVNHFINIYTNKNSIFSIRLRTFLNDYKQFSNLDKWSIPIKKEETSFKYNGHFSESRTTTLKSNVDLEIVCDFPKGEASDSNILKWVTKYEKASKIKYDRIKKLNILNKTQRCLFILIDSNIYFYADYVDGKLIINDILVKDANRNGISIFNDLKKHKIINDFFTEDLKKDIIFNIEDYDRPINSIILSEEKIEHHGNNLKFEEQWRI